MRHEMFDSQGRLRARRDDTARTLTRWDEDGNVVEERAYTSDEVAEADSRVTETKREDRYDTLLERVQGAQQGNKTFLGNTSPTAAQNAAQVKALTQQNNALMTLVLRLAGRFDALDTTD